MYDQIATTSPSGARRQRPSIHWHVTALNDVRFSPKADIPMGLFIERRVHLLAGVADFLDGLANGVGTHSILSGDVVDLVRLAR